MTRILLICCLLTACQKTPVQAPGADHPEPRRGLSVAPSEPPEAPSEGPTEPVQELGAPSLQDLQTVVRLLSVRDGEPVCADVSAAVPNADPVATYLYVIQTVSMPPTAPMRAAACLIDGHAEAAAVSIKGWMSGAETAGLARLVLGRLNHLPEPLAVACVELALEGDLAEDARSAAGDSEHPGVQALIAGAPTAE